MSPRLNKTMLVGTLAVLITGCAFHEEKNPTDPAAQIKLGDIYSSGTWKISKNDETAAFWYGKAALQGDAEGEYHLGLCYEHGLGIPKNEALAVRWFLKAAEAGNPAAQYELGNFHRLAIGGPCNLTKAYFWYNIAAASGNTDAREFRDAVAKRMTDAEIREAHRQSQEFWTSSR